MNPHKKGNAFLNKQVPGDPRLLDQLQRLQVRTMGAMTHTHSGVLIDVGNKSRRAAKVADLKLQIKNGSEAGKYVITKGVVNGQDPTLGGVAIGGDPEADPVVDVPEFTVTATTYAWIKCVGVFATPDTYTVTIETTTTAGVPAGTAISATGFTSFFYVGEVEFTAGSPATYAITNQHSGGNLGVDSWGLYNLWWRA